MSPLLEGLPADIYSNLWILQAYRKLDKGYIPGPTNYLLDQPPENVVALFKSIQELGRY